MKKKYQHRLKKFRLAFRRYKDMNPYYIHDVPIHCALTIPDEMFDFIKVLEHSMKIGKYPANNWLKNNGHGCAHKTMYASIFRHVAEAYCKTKKDNDSGFDPRLHAAVRLLMDYTRDKKKLKHKEDH